MNRRGFLTAASLLALAAGASHMGWAAPKEGEAAEATPFSWEMLKERARLLAEKPFDIQNYKPPTEVAELNYDQYRFIHFNPDKAIWRAEGLPYRLQLFHLGYIYKEPVEIFLLEDGKAARLAYNRDFYEFGPAERRVTVPDGGGGYSGFRIHAPIYTPDDFSEFLVFQGASYFRAKSKDQTYGLSARGMAIDTAQGGPEEFPSFRKFWVEKPRPGEKGVEVYALLDSVSVSGAYHFKAVAGSVTAMEVECQLYPRKSLNHAGIAPFSSMFFFGPQDHSPADDFRPRVHDSDGLSIHTGNGDWIWRPLVTAPHILYSVFFDSNPAGFGLIQRERDFDQYEDIGAEYHNRPSAWVEPIGDWGEGSVDLIELPTDTEYVDNIVAFWRPKDPLQPGQSYNYRYKLTWPHQAPVPAGLAKVKQTRAGLGLAPGSRFLLIDFAGGDLYANASEEHFDFDVHASAGYIKAFSVTPHPLIDGKRIGIEYYPDGIKVADLSFQIRRMGVPISEKWVYRWAP